MVHTIKIKESFADAVYEGRKNFEVRENDRGYQAGDIIKFLPITNSSVYTELTTHPLYKKKYLITYVFSGLGIKEGYVVLGIKPTDKDDKITGTPVKITDKDCPRFNEQPFTQVDYNGSLFKLIRWEND